MARHGVSHYSFEPLKIRSALIRNGDGVRLGRPILYLQLPGINDAKFGMGKNLYIKKKEKIIYDFPVLKSDAKVG